LVTGSTCGGAKDAKAQRRGGSKDSRARHHAGRYLHGAAAGKAPYLRHCLLINNPVVTGRKRLGRFVDTAIFISAPFFSHIIPAFFERTVILFSMTTFSICPFYVTSLSG